MSLCGDRKWEFLWEGMEHLSSSSYKATVLPDWGSNLPISFNLNCLPKTLSPDTVILGVRTHMRVLRHLLHVLILLQSLPKLTGLLTSLNSIIWSPSPLLPTTNLFVQQHPGPCQHITPIFIQLPCLELLPKKVDRSD